jgi:hypothetical protein
VVLLVILGLFLWASGLAEKTPPIMRPLSKESTCLPKAPLETKLDAEIQSAARQADVKPRQDVRRIRTIVEHITTLHKLKTEETGVSIDNLIKMREMETRENRFKPISLDTALVVAANIFGILWLTRFEREHVIPSKSALGFVMKPR